MMLMKKEIRAIAREIKFEKMNFEFKLSENYFHSDYRTQFIQMKFNCGWVWLCKLHIEIWINCIFLRTVKHFFFLQQYLISHCFCILFLCFIFWSMCFNRENVFRLNLFEFRKCGSSIIVIIIIKARYFSLTMRMCWIYVYVSMQMDIGTIFGHINLTLLVVCCENWCREGKNERKKEKLRVETIFFAICILILCTFADSAALSHP